MPERRRPRSRPLALTLAAGLLTMGALAAARPGAPADEPAAAIRAVLDQQVADWNRGDLDGFAAGYWRSPELVFQSGGDRSLGWDAMRERYRKRYQAEGKAMGRLRFSDVEVRLLGPDAGYAYGRWELTMPDGSHPAGLYTVLLRRLPEGWKVVHDHTSSAP